MKLLVIIIDGGTWRVLDKYCLPFIQSFQQRAILHSPIPITQPATATMFTGKEPHEHGLESFTKNGRLLTRKNLNVPYVWENINACHGIVNIPGTYPIVTTSKTKLLVCGFDSPGHNTKGFKTYYPDYLPMDGYYFDLLHELKLHPNNEQKVIDKKTILKWCIETLNARILSCIQWWKIFSDIKLYIISLTEFDRLMHFCFGIEEYEKEFLVTQDHYIEQLNYFCQPDNILIVSDHGFCGKDDTENGKYYLEHMPKLGPNMEGVHSHDGIITWSGPDIKITSDKPSSKIVADVIKNVFK